MRRTTILALLAGIALPLAASDDAPPLQDLMTAEDFKASGLDRLNEAQLEHLGKWVERYREGAVAGPEVVKKPSEMTREELDEKKKEIDDFELVAKVLPAFRGWRGKTVFELDNGQVWRQRQSGTMNYSGNDSTVVITRNWLGKYNLEHPETGRAIGVKRID